MTINAHLASHTKKETLTIRVNDGTCGRYSTLLRFWPEDAAELADICTGCGEVARGGSSFALNFSVTRSTVLSEAERRR